MILTRFPEEGLPQIFFKMKRSQDLSPSLKNAESAKTKNRNIDASPMMWGLLMILTRFPGKIMYRFDRLSHNLRRVDFTKN